MASAVAQPIGLVECPASSASGIITLLEEDDVNLQIHALKKLSSIVDMHWTEVASSIPLIEELHEDESFPQRQLAAFVASRCFFHLEEYSDALRLALGAGDYFNVREKSEYVSSMISKCIDEYKRLRCLEFDHRQQQIQEEQQPVDIDPRMVNIVERMFDRCFAEGAFVQAIGIALESRRLDRIEQAIRETNDPSYLIKYIFTVSQTSLSSQSFRLEVIDVLVRMHRTQTSTDHGHVCQCLQILNRPGEVADVLNELIAGTEDQTLLAYQIALDLVESGSQDFLFEVCKKLPFPAQSTSTSTTTTSGEGAGAESKENGDADAAATDPDAMDTAAATAATATAASTEGNGPDRSRVDKLYRILRGGFLIDLTLNFLFSETKTDPAILNRIRDLVEIRPVLHNATVVTHGYLQAGTTRDKFLRDNLPWMGKASSWAKFTATASLGVVHRGNVRQAMRLLQPYLPQATAVGAGAGGGGGGGGSYSEGGALYALGLIHANCGGMDFGKGQPSASSASASSLSPSSSAASAASSSAAAGTGEAAGAGGGGSGGGDGANIVRYLEEALVNAGNSAAVASAAGGGGGGGNAAEPIQHGACLGIGLSAMATGDATLYETLKNVLNTDSAIAGEGAALGIGLLLAGTGTQHAVTAEAVPELLGYAKDTKHEKIIRALSIALALMVYGQEEGAQPLVEQMARDRDPVLRYGAMYATGLAYAGTGNNAALRRLLHVAVSDVSDDVRRAAVTCIGFLLFRTPDQVPRLVGLLSESFNAHVRYGCCLAIGIACHGTGNREALALLFHLLEEDFVDFVKQGALMAIAMVLMEQVEGVKKKAPAKEGEGKKGDGVAAAGEGKEGKAGKAEEEEGKAKGLLGQIKDKVVKTVGGVAGKDKKGEKTTRDAAADKDKKEATKGKAGADADGADSGAAKALLGGRYALPNFRDRLHRMVHDKHQTLMTRMGAIIASGILDGGGRNVCISLQSRGGFAKMSSIVSIAVWAQHWYWYPLLHFLPLSFAPTMLVGLNKDLNRPKMDKFKVVCKARPALFAYPDPILEKKDDKRDRLVTAVLSTTAKANARLAKKKKAEEEAMGGGGGEGGEGVAVKKEGGETMEVEKEDTKDEKEKKEGGGKEDGKEGEEMEEAGGGIDENATEYALSDNPCRVTRAQEVFVVLDPTSRYRPISTVLQGIGSDAVGTSAGGSGRGGGGGGGLFGVVVLSDSTPDEEDADVDPVEVPTLVDGEEEADPPEPFEWGPDD